MGGVRCGVCKPFAHTGGWHCMCAAGKVVFAVVRTSGPPAQVAYDFTDEERVTWQKSVDPSATQNRPVKVQSSSVPANAPEPIALLGFVTSQQQHYHHLTSHTRTTNSLSDQKCCCSSTTQQTGSKRARGGPMRICYPSLHWCAASRGPAEQQPAIRATTAAQIKSSTAATFACSLTSSSACAQQWWPQQSAVRLWAM